jgi:hypothetical protein
MTGMLWNREAYFRGKAKKENLSTAPQISLRMMEWDQIMVHWTSDGRVQSVTVGANRTYYMGACSDLHHRFFFSVLKYSYFGGVVTD